ncbi:MULTISPECIES: FtsH protease activity modulator HflK [unclassified Thioalkalivibrio]|uniref:FtsH protease activity modulator HflK n=1 Tax=unclassified Thioalkalivibrio TaxID=2621013 RepID=UPI000379B2A1|nr:MULTISPECIES: FtsH protease activity modulator HflK [unclassified Thioalkalivibrio]
MPWNEPGNNNRDPWSGGGGGQRGSGGGGGGGNQPPDLEEMMRKLSRQLNGIFGGGGSGGSGGSGGGMGRGAQALVSLGLIIALVVWLASGFHIISEGERGVVLRFGEFQQVKNPGPGWHLPYPIERIEIENVDNVRTLEHRALILTGDENIIDVDIAVQYRILDLVDYLFNVRNPNATVNRVMESAIRERIGKNNLEFILGEGRGEIASSSRVVMQENLDAYGAGIIVTAVSMQQAQPPEPVQESFADAIRAREDEVRFRNEAEAYANGVIPRARGQAARIIEEAEGYRDQVIARAEGDASRFDQLLAEYQQAPDVTRDRLYLEAVEAVLEDSRKLMLDVGSSNNLMMLPLDQLFQGAARSGNSSGDTPTPRPLDTSRSVFSNSGSGTSSRLGDRDPAAQRSREVR